MYRDLYWEFARVSRPRLHYIYGASCYQHALGLSTPMVMIQDPQNEPNVKSMFYFTLGPGRLDRDLQSNKMERFDRLVIEHCVIDELIERGNSPEQRKDFRTVALFTNPNEPIYNQPDYHVAFLNEDGLWEDKIPIGLPQTYQSIAEIEYKKRGYKFVCYFLAPKGAKPKVLDDCVFNSHAVGDGKERSEILLIDPNSDIPPLNGMPAFALLDQDIIIFPDRKLCGVIPPLPV